MAIDAQSLVNAVATLGYAAISWRGLRECLCEILPGAVPVIAPVATAATPIFTDHFRARWNPVLGATSYHLDVSTSPIFASFVTGYNNVTSFNNDQCLVGPLVPGTTYYYRVRALNGVLSSPNSNVITVVTLAEPAFAYNPPAAIITWDDGNGPGQSGDLAFFNANADFPTVSAIHNWFVGINSVVGLSHLGQLSALIANAVNQLTALSLYGFSGAVPPIVIRLEGNNLNQDYVTLVLCFLDQTGLLNGTINISGQNPPAGPSAGPPDGNAAKASLIGKGWAVTTD